MMFAWAVLVGAVAAVPQSGSLEAVTTAYESYRTFYAAGEWAEAERAATEALALGEQWYGKDDPRTAALTYNHGDARRVNGNLEGARSTLMLALERFEQAYGAEALETIDPIMALGETAVAAGSDDANELFFTAIDRARAGGSTRLAGELEDSAGNIWLRANDPARARPWLDRAIATLSAIKGTDALVRSTRIQLYGSLVDTGGPELAAACAALGIDGPWPTGQEAVPIYRTSAVYPPGPLERGVEGDVVLEFEVGTDCRPVGVRVVQATGSLSFRTSAEVAVSQWHFAPELHDGRPVASNTVRTRVEFRIANVR
jgi:TonB family protein